MKISCNCIICSDEFDASELHNIALSKINITAFKVCEACFNYSNPTNDYLEVKRIVNSYLKFAYVKSLFDDVADILDSRPE